MSEETSLAKPEAEVVKQPDQPPYVVFARNPQEMAAAQTALISWASRKIVEVKEEHAELLENYEIAKKNKWRTATLYKHANLASKRVTFYEKVKVALEEGYCIIPNFPVDTFAVRTDRVSPKSGVHDYASTARPVKSEALPAGDGRYVSSEALVVSNRQVVEHLPGKEPRYKWEYWAEDFQDVSFPFAMAKPSILSVTAQAMASKIFDDLGVLPRRPNSDPMVIGRIGYKDGHNVHQISFLVAWFVDVRDL